MVETTEDKKLYRSRRDRMIAGVAGGIAEYFRVDPSLVRLIWVGLALMGGSGLLLYIIAALIIPSQPQDEGEGRDEDPATSTNLGAVVLIAVGIILLLRPFIPRVGLAELLLGLGLVLLGMAVLSKK